MKIKCCNCSDCGEVSVSIPCPECVGAGQTELSALRDLADALRLNFLTRATRPKTLCDLLARVDTAQGRTVLVDQKSGWHTQPQAKIKLGAWKANGLR